MIVIRGNTKSNPTINDSSNDNNNNTNDTNTVVLMMFAQVANEANTGPQQRLRKLQQSGAYRVQGLGVKFQGLGFLGPQETL